MGEGSFYFVPVRVCVCGVRVCVVCVSWNSESRNPGHHMKKHRR